MKYFPMWWIFNVVYVTVCVWGVVFMLHGGVEVSLHTTVDTDFTVEDFVMFKGRERLQKTKLRLCVCLSVPDGRSVQDFCLWGFCCFPCLHIVCV